MIIDKSCNIQILGSLMQRPSLLSQRDRYNLSIMDFSSRFERLIFASISGLYQNGATNINPIDIENYLNYDSVASKFFQTSNGLEFLQDALELSELSNFDYYYNKLKKINLLNSLKQSGFDISEYYDDNPLNLSATKVNENFEDLTLQDILDGIKGKIFKLENNYVTTGEVKTQTLYEGLEALVDDMFSNQAPKIGLAVQGQIYNQVIDGAQKTTLTIRSGGSGVGKTRQAVGDACALAYPIIFDWGKDRWIQQGSSEKVLFIVTEQTFEQVRKMVLAYITGINETKFKYKNLNSAESRIVKQAIEILRKFEDNFILVQMPNPTIELVKAKIRSECITKNIGYVFYDYIFIGPSLLQEFKGFNLRNDEVLLMFATALKDLANELNICVMTATQVNANADDNKNIRSESSLAGGRATINKADNGAIMTRPTKDELEILKPLTDKYEAVPNIVTDIFKVRSGQWTQVRIWSEVDLGTMRKRDLFITNSFLDPIEDFFDTPNIKMINWDSEEEKELQNYVKELNGEK